MNFEQKLKSGKFVITAEVSPPRGVDVSSFIEKTLLLKNRIDAVNVTDFQNVGVRITSLVGSYLLLREGFEPIFQITARDRNRVAISGELLSAYALGIRNVLVLTGDYTTTGIVKSAKPVFDLDATNILVIAKKLEEGEDFSGKKLNKSPDFFLGAVFNPNLVPLEIEILKLLKKKKAGAEFFQTQLFFELSLMERVRDRVGDDVKIIAGVTIFKSLEMLEYMMDNVPGIKIPERVIEMFKNTKDIKALSIEFCVEFCSKLKESKLLDGIHFLASRPSDIIKVLDLLKW
ncbi:MULTISPECIES: methylenetetrahydrofolate reductase [Dictyoglomus]|uniref:Methylenetetrahydrofolate reductase n=1 Tax=Dictyoglomus turgidum (strain DSM 6724 / Z-1310) TaxID=515635 RepID=B8E333_DICTD|nr:MULTISPECIES: methylenetetrahydrofolate reductase [Dictyoglomus]ACK42907.1 methylenetetrahydrofolate reductase [Dictyoglomus turgidum DSM 6724]HBU30969.1 5,10-methylenetetrahydrofolate reductase [Dictyoglomus sp.]